MLPVVPLVSLASMTRDHITEVHAHRDPEAREKCVSTEVTKVEFLPTERQMCERESPLHKQTEANDIKSEVQFMFVITCHIDVIMPQ